MAKPILVRIVGEADFDKAASAVGKFGKVASGLALGAGVAVAGALAVGFSEELNLDAAQDKLQAQLGLTGEQAAEAGRIAGSLYANAYGDSLDEVSSVVADAIALGVPTDEIEAISAQAFSMGQAFEGAAGEYLQLAQQFADQGFTDNAQQSLDLIATSFQQLPQNMRGPLTEAINEYGTFLDGLGFTTEEIFGGLTKAAEGGQFELDKFGDAIKEFGIRATDNSKASSAAIAEALNINPEIDTEAYDAAINSLLAGGDAAQETFQGIIDGLLAIDDPSAQAASALALFGSPLEDLGVQNIPAFLGSLDEMGAGFDDVAGAAAQLDKDINDNLTVRLETLRRKGMLGLAKVASFAVVPAIEGLVGIVERAGAALQSAFERTDFLDRMRVAIGKVGDALAPLVDLVGEVFAALSGDGAPDTSFIDGLLDGVVRATELFADLVGFFTSTAVPAIRGFADEFSVLAASVLPSVLPVLSQIGEAFVAFGGLIAATIGAAVAVLSFIWSRWGDEISSVVVTAFRLVTDVISGAVSIITGIFKVLTGILTGDWSLAWQGMGQIVRGAWQIITGIIRAGLGLISAAIRAGAQLVQVIWSGLWSAMGALARAGWSAIKGFVTSGIGAVVGAIRRMPGKIASAASGMFNGILDAFRGVLNRIRELWSGLSFKIPSVNIPVLGRVGGGSFSLPSLPFFAQGGAVTRATLGVLGEGANISATNPEIVSPRNIMADTLRQVLRAEQPARQSGPLIENVYIEGGAEQILATLDQAARAYGFAA